MANASPATKTFGTLDVISAITGVLVTPRHMDGVYEVLNWMTGESLFTHQLPRIGREAQAAMLERNPDLGPLFREAKEVTRENWREWGRRWLDRYGPTMKVHRLTRDEHEARDALSELAEFAPPEKRIMVVTQ